MLSHTLIVVSPHRLLSAICALSVFVALFVETGLLVGLFVPADSLLFGAGLLCATWTSTVAGERPSLTAVLIAAIAGASLGAQTGYLRGAHDLPGLLTDPDQPRLRHLVTHTHRVLERHGGTRAVMLTRFVPVVVRTVVNPLAAATGISAGRFAAAQLVGTVVWTTGLVFAGDLLGTTVPSVEDHVVLSSRSSSCCPPSQASSRTVERGSPPPTLNDISLDELAPPARRSPLIRA